jgi:uncharacterized protein YabN with tetrapyrrole methylase and pyrophosphatase domain
VATGARRRRAAEERPRRDQRVLPALAASQEMQERAANLGYDWPSIDGVLDKVHEELGELLAAETDENRRPRSSATC